MSLEKSALHGLYAAWHAKGLETFNGCPDARLVYCIFVLYPYFGKYLSGRNVLCHNTCKFCKVYKICEKKAGLNSGSVNHEVVDTARH